MLPNLLTASRNARKGCLLLPGDSQSTEPLERPAATRDYTAWSTPPNRPPAIVALDYLASATEALSGLQPWDDLASQALPRAADSRQVRAMSAPRSAGTTRAAGVCGPEAWTGDCSCESGGSRADTRRHNQAGPGAGTPRGPGEAAPEEPPRERARGKGGGRCLPSSAVSVCPCVPSSSALLAVARGSVRPVLLTGVTLAARSTWNPGSLKSLARAGRLPVFLGWPPNGSSRLRPSRLCAGTRLRRGVGSRRVPQGQLKAGYLQFSPARLSGLL